MTLEQLEEKLRGREPADGRSGQYAVLVPLVEREGKLHILYEVRSQDMRRSPGRSASERIEGDETPEACAIRETEEELGIPQHPSPSGTLDLWPTEPISSCIRCWPGWRRLRQRGWS